MKTLVIAMTVLMTSSAFAGLKSFNQFSVQEINRMAKYEIDVFNTQSIVFNEAEFGLHFIDPWKTCTDGTYIYGPDVTLTYCQDDDDNNCKKETVALVQPIEGTRMKCFKWQSDNSGGNCVEDYFLSVPMVQETTMKLKVMTQPRETSSGNRKSKVVGYKDFTIATCPDAKAN